MLKLPDIRFGSTVVGFNANCFVIAEAGVNHNGSRAMAIELVKRAKQCGAHCIKFQTFRAEGVVTRSSPKADYQLKVTDPSESQYDMLKRLELSYEDHRAIIHACAEQEILFLSTPYSLEDAEMLNDLGVVGFKLASAQLVEISLLKKLAKFGKPLIISTGMATMGEVCSGVEAIRAAGNEQIIVLQCTTNYPSAISDTNLRAMVAMRAALGVTVGYSDHTQGISACLASVALGASLVEKHFTLDCTLPGPDHSSSSDPHELTALCKGICDVERALGMARKIPSASELRNLAGMRRSIVARKDIKNGTILTDEHLTFKRPATGIAPNRIDEILGLVVKVDVPADTQLDLKHFF